MNISEIFLLVLGILILIALIVLLGRKNEKPVMASSNETRQMRLAAYERLVLLIDRIALPNLLTRTNAPGISARELQQVLIQNIKQEFDYNVTQQVYVSLDAWTAVKNLKEQNQLAINQIANALPPNATGLDLSKYLLEYILHDKRGALHEMASEVVSVEAKKLL